MNDTLPSKRRCRRRPGLDLVDLVVVERHEARDDKGKGVESFSYGVDAGSLEDEIYPWPRSAAVCRFEYALGLEFLGDPHFVVGVGCERIGTSYGAFGKHDHP